jgi:hypothetical protein
MLSTGRRYLLPGLAICLCLAGRAESQPPPNDDSAWSALVRLRDSLVDRGPQRVDFTQVFVPAGFKEGDEERGRLALSLPDCLRWDYTSPYPKVYLLCGDVVYSWNPGEPSGRRYPVDTRQAPGLDLLRMRVEALRQRYAARLVRNGQHLSVTLTPLHTVADIRDATFEFDSSDQTLAALAYHDQDGGLTRFQFADYRPLGDLALFSPPDDLSWQSD